MNTDGLPILTVTEGAARETRERERRWEAAGAPAHEVIALEAFDPGAAGQNRTERRFCCPLPGVCASKSKTADHRSLTVNMTKGTWECKRCKAAGLLGEKRTNEPDTRSAVTSRATRRCRLREMNDMAAILGVSTMACAKSPPPRPSAVDAAPAAPAPEPKGEEWRGMLADLRPLAGTLGATYLQARGIRMDLAVRSGARYCSRWYRRPAVVFPIRDRDGRLVSAHGRHTDTRTPKAHSAPDIRAGVFWTPGASVADTLAVAEAPIDALSLAATGLPSVALCGTALREWAPRYFAWKRILLAFDADENEAGDEAAQKWVAALRFGSRVERMRPVGAKDWNELLVRDGIDALRTLLVPYLPQPVLAPPQVSGVASGTVGCADYLQTACVTAAEGPVSVAATTPDGTHGSTFAGSDPREPGRPETGLTPSVPGATDLLAPFVALTAQAVRGELPPGPVHLSAGVTVHDPALCILSAVDEIRRLANDERRLDLPIWRGVLDVRLEKLRLLDEWWRAAS